MADDTTQPTNDRKSKNPGVMTLVKAMAFVGVIVLLEVGAASMIIPSAEETMEIAEKLAAAHTTEAADEETESSTETAEDQLLASKETREVALGTFHVLSYNPESGTSLNVDLDLYGIVLADEESEFFDLFTANEQRIREQVFITIRSTDITDLTDAGLGLIKRKILEKTNRALGRPLLNEVVFSKFSFMER